MWTRNAEYDSRYYRKSYAIILHPNPERFLITAFPILPVPIIPTVIFCISDELYAKSDIISLHTFLSDETYHMINKDSIAKMKDGVIDL